LWRTAYINTAWAGEIPAIFYTIKGYAMEFPRLVYRSASVHVVAEDVEAYDMFIADGWFSSVPEAMEGKQKAKAPEVIQEPEASQEKDEQKEDDAPPTREEMEAKAQELGIRFDGRTRDAKLMALINEKLG
jgi:hypothetical protein